MSMNVIARVVAALSIAGRQPATLTGTTGNPSISATSGTPPGNKVEGPAACGADRAWVLTAEKNHELPVSEAGAASFNLTGTTPAAGFPHSKAESTQAARLAHVGWALQRANWADGSDRYVATRWDSESANMTTLDAVVLFADRVGAPS